MSIETNREELSTHEKLLEAAESLFLSKGYNKVSVRDITEAAGANVAAVNYHFGGKQNLYREFIRTRLAESSKEKSRVLNDILMESDEPDLRKLLRVYVSSSLGCTLSDKGGMQFLELLSNEMNENSAVADILYKEAVVPTNRILKAALLKAMPEMTPEHANLCIASIAGQVFHFVRAREIIKRIVGRGYTQEFIEEIAQHITEFSLRGIGWFPKEG